MFENENDREAQGGHYLPKAEINNYNVVNNGQNFFEQPIKNNLRTYDNIRKTATGKGDNYTTGCLLDYYPYFKEYYMLIQYRTCYLVILVLSYRIFHKIRILEYFWKITTKLF